MVRTQIVEQGATEICAAFQCGYPELFVQVALVIWFGALLFLTIFACLSISSAQDEVSAERSRVRAERNAFRGFRRRVNQLEPTPQQASGMVTTTGIVQRGPPDPQLPRVREAYEETVMAVPHYDEDYGESLATHMTTEFGDELAAAVVGGEQFTPQVKEALLKQATANQLRREELLRALDSESEALTEVKAKFRAVERVRKGAHEGAMHHRSYEELDETWRELERLEADVEAVLDDRQESMQTGLSVGPRGEGHHAFNEYIYGSHQTSYPVLSSGIELLDRIRDTKHRVLESLARRV